VTDCLVSALWASRWLARTARMAKPKPRG
jgi:hypothetical protein